MSSKVNGDDSMGVLQGIDLWLPHGFGQGKGVDEDERCATPIVGIANGHSINNGFHFFILSSWGFSDRTDSSIAIIRLSKFYFEFFQEESISGEFWRSCLTSSCVKVIFWVAGFRPGSRGPFLSGKGPKTIDALSGF